MFSVFFNHLKDQCCALTASIVGDNFFGCADAYATDFFNLWKSFAVNSLFNFSIKRPIFYTTFPNFFLNKIKQIITEN